MELVDGDDILSIASIEVIPNRSQSLYEESLVDLSSYRTGAPMGLLLYQ